MTHRVYETIVKKVKSGRLKEPFSSDDLKRTCPEIKETTCRSFLSQHRRGNPRRNNELFQKVNPGRFKLIRPLKYGL